MYWELTQEWPSKSVQTKVVLTSSVINKIQLEYHGTIRKGYCKDNTYRLNTSPWIFRKPVIFACEKNIIKSGKNLAALLPSIFVY
mgnify:CR=1 FL=1